MTNDISLRPQRAINWMKLEHETNVLTSEIEMGDYSIVTVYLHNDDTDTWTVTVLNVSDFDWPFVVTTSETN